MCLFCLWTCCAVSVCKYLCQNWSLKYKIQYEIQFFSLSSLKDTLQICRSKRLNHTTISNYHWFTDPKFCKQCIWIFQRKQTKADLSILDCTVVLRVTSSGCLKLSPSMKVVFHENNLFITFMKKNSTEAWTIFQHPPSKICKKNQPPTLVLKKIHSPLFPDPPPSIKWLLPFVI